MKSSFDVVDIVWEHLSNSSFKSEISGDVYKHLRPINSKNEDVVISSLGMNNLQLQSGYVNVNLFIPNLITRTNNVQGYMPDHERLKYLTGRAFEELDDVWIDDCHFEIENQEPPSDYGDAETFINIRLKFYSENL